jgi:hypothetical protein
LDADHEEDTPLRFRALHTIIGQGTLPRPADRTVEDELHFISAEEPSSFRKAEQQECWRKEMEEEMQSIVDNHTWDLVELPRGHRAIGLKWVFKVKQDEAGRVVRYKARLIAKGYMQQASIDYDEVFAPVARIESVRLLLALAAHKGWEVHHMDVKSAFLNDDLQEEVYVSQPAGFIISGAEDKVLRLHKALYGLKQTPRAWNAKFDTTMGSLGFQRSCSEHGIYTRTRGGHRLIVGVYVDDLVISGADREEMLAFKAEMQDIFKMSDLGLLSYYLGIEVSQGPGGINLSQGAYANKLLERSGLQDCNPAATPMEQRLKMWKDSTTPEVNATEYRRIIGGLKYLIHTRPDLACSVGFLIRFMERPHEEHLAAVKRVLRYIAGTRGHGLYYTRGDGAPAKLMGYSDADLAGDVDQRKSTSGIAFFLNNSPITWQSSKQKVVALSSCEAEYIAAANAACQGVWLARLLGDFVDSAPELKVDNMSAIALTKNPVFHDRSKHIDVRYHFIRECVEKNRVSVEHISTEAQLVDILTKALGRVRFQELCAMIGVKNINGNSVKV